ncbi:MAG: AmmeMemoRadiSam system protein B [Blastochloris sp.]|nr:AmmeMemoRadiSam system protein B [Blastochloris sp.]
MSASPLLPAAFAGTCYPAEPDLLLKTFSHALQNSPNPTLGPRLKNRLASCSLFWLPHIDFRVNLELYASIYRLIAERPQLPAHILILGVGHRCPHEFSLCPHRFSTPLGQVDTDIDLLTQIESRCPFPIRNAASTYRREHSLEFVIIWLQALQHLFFPQHRFKVLPVLLGGLHQSLHDQCPPQPDSAPYLFGQALMESLPDDTLVIASIDGCHVGPRFDHDFPGDDHARRIVESWENNSGNIAAPTVSRPFSNTPPKSKMPSTSTASVFSASCSNTATSRPGPWPAIFGSSPVTNPSSASVAAGLTNSPPLPRLRLPQNPAPHSEPKATHALLPLT